MNDKTVQRAVDHLSVFADQIISAYHEGTYDGVTAKLKLQQEILATLQDLRPAAFESRLWLRISLPHVPTALARVLDVAYKHGSIVAANYVGPRDEGLPAVLYLTLRNKRPAVSVLLEQLHEIEGVGIRDWRFGCIRRDAA